MPSLVWFLPFFQGLFLGILAMALHEAGHLLTALAVGVRIKSIGFRWKGLYTVREAGPPAKNLLISLAGPTVNLVLILCWHWSHNFGMANLCFSLVNLLPLRGSDGERALKCWSDMQRLGRSSDAEPVPGATLEATSEAAISASAPGTDGPA